MKVLVVDNDAASRAALLRVLSHLDVEGLEAVDGVDAVHSIEIHCPDLILLDTDLPRLNGFETLATIRSSLEFSDLPVVVVSEAGDPESVRRLMHLGISDFVLKPINTEETFRRLRSVLHRTASWKKEKSVEAVENAGTIMVVEPDANFRDFVKSVLEQQFRVLTANSGADAFRVYKTNRPSIVLVAEGLPLVSEHRLLGMLHDAASDSDIAPPQVIVTSATELASEASAQFDGAIQKTFVPDDFVEEFNAVVGCRDSRFQSLSMLVKTGLRGDILSASQHTLGVMTQQDAAVSQSPLDEGKLVVARVNVDNKQEAIRLVIGFTCSAHDAETLASRVLRREISLDSGAGEVVGELATTVGARLRASLADRGYHLELAMPAVEIVESDAEIDDEWLVKRGFATSEGQRFEIALRTEELEAWIGDEPAPQPETASVEASTPSSDESPSEPSGGDQELEDVLF